MKRYLTSLGTTEIHIKAPKDSITLQWEWLTKKKVSTIWEDARQMELSSKIMGMQTDTTALENGFLQS